MIVFPHIIVLALKAREPINPIAGRTAPVGKGGPRTTASHDTAARLPLSQEKDR